MSTSTTERVRFRGSLGHELSARLDVPLGEPRAYALFAHCFTCSKNTLAAARVSRGLAELGIAVLRFDFTGLGASGGDFASTDFSSNVTDLVLAADWLRDHRRAPSLVIGHSLGGAAVLVAAHEIPEATAVATIGAPSEPSHVRGLLGDRAGEIEERGEAEVDIAGRKFRIRRELLRDLEAHNLLTRLATLHSALLVMHAVADEVVDIEHARRIYEAARHPKSFVSLGDADHLLTRREDAAYVACVLAAWSSRYVAHAQAAQIAVGDAASHVTDAQIAVADAASHVTDAQSAVGDAAPHATEAQIAVADAAPHATEAQIALGDAAPTATSATRALDTQSDTARETAPAPRPAVLVREAGNGKFKQEVLAGRHRLIADEPVRYGGDDAGPSPYDLLLAALGTCTSMTVRMYADRKRLALERVSVALDHEKIHAQDCAACEQKEGKIDHIERVLALRGNLDAPARAKLLEIADKCPVHRTLVSKVHVTTRLAPEAALGTGAAPLPQSQDPADAGADTAAGTTMNAAGTPDARPKSGTDETK